jgi:ribonuclease Z
LTHSGDSKDSNGDIRKNSFLSVDGEYSKDKSSVDKKEIKEIVGKKKQAAKPFLDSLLGLLGRKSEPEQRKEKSDWRERKLLRQGDKEAVEDEGFEFFNPRSSEEEKDKNESSRAKIRPTPPTAHLDLYGPPTRKAAPAYTALNDDWFARRTKLPRPGLRSISQSLTGNIKASVLYHKHKHHFVASRPEQQEIAAIKNTYKLLSRGRERMKSYIQFVTVPTGDTAGTCLMLHYDHRRYLFGQIGEGTMRACNELGLSLRKVQKIFISGQTTRETSGGLLGMLLTLADANAAANENNDTNGTTAKRAKSGEAEKATDVEVYGPPNLVHSVAAARRFIFRKSTPTLIRDLEDAPVPTNEDGQWLPRVLDENVDVFALVVRPETNEQIVEAEKIKDKIKRRISGEGEDIEEQKNLIRQRIINDMFNSKWRLDTLVEKYLHEVDQPAKMWYRDQETKDLKEYTGPLPPDPSASRTLKVFVRNPWPAAMITALPPTTPKPDAVSYIMRGRVTRGKFDKAKAIALKIPPGPLFAQLAKGSEITLKDGTVVKPEQVLGPDIQAGGFAILDIPSQDYIEALIGTNRETRRLELDSKSVMAGVDTIIWILGPGILAHPGLRKYIRSQKIFAHVISSPDTSRNHLVACGAATSAIKLAQIDLKSFPVPYHDDVAVPAPNFRREAKFWDKEVKEEDNLFSFPNVTLAQRGLTVQLDPKREVCEKDAVKPLNTLELITTPQSADVIELAKGVRTSAESGPLADELKDWRQGVLHEDAEIVTLGTGSAMPSRYRNVSSNLVRVPGWGSYLLDAGENTLGQLQRVYKPAELVEVLRDLRMIWISHGHADHHLGTVSVIKAWYDVVHGRDTKYPPVSQQVVQILTEEFAQSAGMTGAPLALRPKYLAVMGNRFMMDYLRDISQVEEFGFSHVLPVINSPASGNSNAVGRTNSVFGAVQVVLPGENRNDWMSNRLSTGAKKGFLGVRDVSAVGVEHCSGARALHLKFGGPPNTPRFSVAYSGDCRPSSAFAKAAQGATVLIHEATFDDDLKMEAVAKKHSTVAEAIGVASLMQAKSLVLTHFSQRYQKIPVLDDVWGRVSEVERQLVREEGRDDVEGRAKGPGAGEEVDEIAGDEEEVIMSAVANAGGETEADEMDTDEDLPAAPLTTNGSKRDIPILFAFDYMRVRVGDMPMLRAYRPALSKLFETEIGELEDRKIRRMENAAGLKRAASKESLNTNTAQLRRVPSHKLLEDTVPGRPRFEAQQKRKDIARDQMKGNTKHPGSRNLVLDAKDDTSADAGEQDVGGVKRSESERSPGPQVEDGSPGKKVKAEETARALTDGP